METLLKDFYDRSREIFQLNCIGSLLGWDQQVFLPVAANPARAEQLELVSILVHNRFTDPKFARTVNELNNQLDKLSEDDQVNISDLKYRLDRALKLPTDFVGRKAKLHAETYSIWQSARADADFKLAAPYLQRIFELAREECELLGYTSHPYDALLDTYERGTQLAELKPLLLKLGAELSELIPRIASQFSEVDPLSGSYALDLQENLCKQVASALGYDFKSGRLDPTAHPFMTTLGPADQRITTRYFNDDFLSALYSTIHEVGHALYEQALDRRWAGTALGEAASMGIHESQSRFYENFIGRSKAFCKFLQPLVTRYFSNQSCGDAEVLWQQCNLVRPSLIRTEADEVTYSQHIIVRTLLEEELLTEKLSIAELPDRWAALYKQYLKIEPSNHREGVLQDVHWYTGSIGYFPTYVLGNLYAARFNRTIRTEISDLDLQVERGQFDALRSWLNQHVHRHGRRYLAKELTNKVAGVESERPTFISYLRQKFLIET